MVFLKRYWWLLVIVTITVVGGLALGLIPGAWPAALPFLAVLLGIVLRTVVPFFEKVLTSMRDTGKWPVFEKQFLIPPLAMLLLDVMWFGVAMLTQPGFVQDVSGLGFVVAVAAGYGGQGFIRDVQKLVIVARRK